MALALIAHEGRGPGSVLLLTIGASGPATALAATYPFGMLPAQADLAEVAGHEAHRGAIHHAEPPFKATPRAASGFVTAWPTAPQIIYRLPAELPLIARSQAPSPHCGAGDVSHAFDATGVTEHLRLGFRCSAPVQVDVADQHPAVWWVVLNPAFHCTQ